jgi:xylulokinase
MSKYLLGIDIGTTNVKSVLFDLKGKIIAQGSAEYSTIFPAAGWVEQDPEQWWQATVETIRQITAKSYVNKHEIAAIGISSQAPTLLPVDIQGKPLRNALIWMDRRSEAQCDFLRQKIGEEKIRSITGNRIDPYFTLSKLLWFKQNEPHLLSKTYKILQVNGYINFKLTGCFSIDKVHASLSQIYDVNQLQWSQELCQQLEITLELLPDVYDCTSVIGTVGKEAAAMTGLPQDIPVIAGTVDGPAAAIEAGVIGSGEAVEMTGTSTVVLMGSDAWRDSGNLTAMYHGFGNHCLVFGAISSTGACLKWFRDQFGNIEKKMAQDLDLGVFELMDLQASKVEAGAENLLFLPYMAGERSPIWDTYARGMFVGLTLNTSRGQMIRAILEGTAFALYHNLKEAAALGLTINELKAVGGGSHSDLWLKIKASMLNIPVLVPETSTGAPFGDAILAGVGIGLYDDVGSIAKQSIKIKKVIEPDCMWHERYMELFEIYTDIYKHTKHDLFKLTNLQKVGR